MAGHRSGEGQNEKYLRLLTYLSGAKPHGLLYHVSLKATQANLDLAKPQLQV